MHATTLRLDEFLPYRLSFTSHLVSERVALSYATRFGLSIPEWRIIAVVAEGDGTTQAAIGERTRMDKVTVSRAAIALTGRGLLARRPNPDDRRSHLLVLSEAGRALHREIAPLALAIERDIVARIGADQVSAFTATLRRIDALMLEVAHDGAHAAPSPSADLL